MHLVYYKITLLKIIQGGHMSCKAAAENIICVLYPGWNDTTNLFIGNTHSFVMHCNGFYFYIHVHVMYS